MAEVKDLVPDMKKVSIILQIISQEEEKEIEKDGNILRVCDFTARDTTGEINVTLWDEDIDKVKVNDKIKISNGMTKLFSNKLIVTPGKYGKVEVL